MVHHAVAVLLSSPQRCQFPCLTSKMPRKKGESTWKTDQAKKRLVEKQSRKLKHARVLSRPGLTFLEQASVKESTLVFYERLARDFVAWTREFGHRWSTDVELDAVLCQKMNSMYFEGGAADDGSRLIAALKFFLPEVSRLGSCSLPRTTRALNAWRKLAPSFQGMPMPFVVLCAIVGFTLRRHLCSAAGRNLGLKWMVAFHTYMRPVEIDRLLSWQIVRPVHHSVAAPYSMFGVLLHPTEAGRPGKTGMWDETVLIDDTRLFPALWHLVTTRPSRESCWLHSTAEDIHAMTDAINALGLQELGLCRYSMRHGGASHDLLTSARTVDAVKRRGRWRSDSSLRRYGKETRILSELNKVAPQVVELGSLVAAELSSLLTKGSMSHDLRRRLDQFVK